MNVTRINHFFIHNIVTTEIRHKNNKFLVFFPIHTLKSTMGQSKETTFWHFSCGLYNKFIEMRKLLLFCFDCD